MRTPSTSHDVKQADDKRYAAPTGLVSAASSFDDDESDDFQPMSSEAAQAWRTRQPRGLIRFLLGYQFVAVFTVTGLLWMAEAIGWMGSISDRAVAVSFAYGGLAIVIPAALMAVGLQGRFTQRLSTTPTGSLLGFAIWEGFKLLVSVALLVAAPKFVSDLSWFALLAGLLVALKVNWLVVALIKARR